MTAGEAHFFRARHVGRGLPRAGRGADLARTPIAVPLAGYRLGHEARQRVTGVGVFEAPVARKDRRVLELRAQLIRGEKRAAIDELAGVRAVAHHARTMA